MESEIPYQRLIELNLIVEGCLRTLAVRESPDTQLMLADCLTEINELAAPLLQQAYQTIEPKTQEEPELPIVTGIAEPDKEILTISEIDEEKASPDDTVEEKASSDDTVEEMASPDDTAEEMASPVEVEETETEELILEDDDLVEIDEEIEEDQQVPISEEPQVFSVEPEEQPTKVKESNTPVEPAKENDLRLDELLSRREARQLRKAFTLNDKFRFRRELFNGDDAMFARTLDMIQAMNSMEEATRYLCDDLGWDSENEHVADFMAIVANHFAEV